MTADACLDVAVSIYKVFTDSALIEILTRKISAIVKIC